MIDLIVLMLAFGRHPGGRRCPFKREICIGQPRRVADRCSPQLPATAGWNRKSEPVWGKKKKKKPSKLKAS